LIVPCRRGSGTIAQASGAGGFHAGLMTRDPDGHAMLLIEK
jgi:hypothetical protein